MGKRMHGREDHPNEKQGQREKNKTKQKNARGSYNKLSVSANSWIFYSTLTLSAAQSQSLWCL